MEETNKNLPVVENQFNFRNIGKAINKFKWFILGATVVGGVAGYLIFSKGVNPGRERMVSSFEFNINAKPKIAEGVTIKQEEMATQTLYLSDSSIFSYTDVVSKERLNAVKEKNPQEFGKINTDKMAENGGISISRASYTDQTTGRVVFEYPARYTLSASKSYFANEKQAKSFIDALLNYQLEVAKTANDNYEIMDYLSGNDNSSYGLFVNNLKSEYDAIDKCFETLIKDFDYSSRGNSNGDTLNKLYSSFISSYEYGASNLILQYEGDLYHNHLVDYHTVTVESLTSQAEAYKENLRNNLIDLKSLEVALEKLITVKINNLEGNTSVIEKEIIKTNEEILKIKEIDAKYIKEIINLGYTVPSEVTLENIDQIIYEPTNEGVIQSMTAGEASWKKQCDDFKIALNEVSTRLQADRKTTSDVYGFVNNQYRNQVNYFTSGVAKMEGHVSSVIGLAVGAVGLFLISTLVFTLVYIAKKDKFEKKEK